ncbi:glycosyltransferase [Citrobacter enshiensis]|uniref:glycosyltransferase n=1 Tax=Citrobacter enshiensis TaxID=2971264 RepID=UPI002E23A129
MKKPTVVSYHSDIVKQKSFLRLYTPLMNRFLNSVNCIVAASPNYAQTSPVLQKFKSKVKVVPYGLDEKSYPKADDERISYWKNKFGDKFFLFVGAFRYYKGLHTLLEAVHTTSLPVVIVGGGTVETELKLRAKELNLSHVHFVGALPDEDKAALLTLCYSVVFPSHLRSEAFGITLLEGALYGKPLISCEIGTGTSYINLNKKTGLVVLPSDKIALRSAMIQLWENEDLAKQYGENAKTRFYELFTSQKMIKGYHSIYNAMISKNS